MNKKKNPLHHSGKNGEDMTCGGDGGAGRWGEKRPPHRGGRLGNHIGKGSKSLIVAV